MAKTLIGVVASDVGSKTIVVNVESHKTHPIYKKQYTVSKKIMAHDENNEARLGDTVVIQEVRPISKRKKFTLQKVVQKAPIQHEEKELEL